MDSPEAYPWTLQNITFEQAMKEAMERVSASYDVAYPDGYYEMLCTKWKGKFPHSRNLLRAGRSRILAHPDFAELVQPDADFLDYGCGAGDDVRTLVRMGHRGKAIGYDVRPECVELGFDLFMDREKMSERFIVSPDFSFDGPAFDVVYSGSVIHVLTGEAITQYINNAFAVLRGHGALFGSDVSESRGQYTVRTSFTPEELKQLLEAAGFRDVEVKPKVIEDGLKLWFHAHKSQQR